MTLLFVLLTVAVVVAVGLVAVGRVTAELAARPPRALFDLDEAVEFVAEQLSFEVSAQLSYDDVRQLLGWHLDYLGTRGVAAGVDEAGTGADAQVPTGLVGADDEAVAFVLGQAGEAGLEVDDVAVFEVLEASGRYLEAIGAIGSPVAPPPPPE